MRTTVDLDDEVLRQAQEYAPELTKTALLEEGLRALVRQRAARRLADAVGTQPELTVPPRRRPA
jgi:Arc/MetJ family transcription regulator